jgi:hypothetical protein
MTTSALGRGLLPLLVVCGAQHAMQWSVGNVVLDSAHLNKKTE